MHAVDGGEAPEVLDQPRGELELERERGQRTGEEARKRQRSPSRDGFAVGDAVYANCNTWKPGVVGRLVGIAVG